MTYKDHFSEQSEEYARFRPAYPDELFEHLAFLSPGNQLAWDCATGSGQAALGLSRNFERVIATDASPQQIAIAAKAPNVEYRLARAEDSGLSRCSVDLITVAQALHWFDLDAFFREADRVLKPGGILAAWTYALLNVSPEVDAVVRRLHSEVVREYWPPERALVEDGYGGIQIPFEALAPPEFSMSACWNLEHLRGYLKSWSAVRGYEADRGSDPLDVIGNDLRAAWGDGSLERKISWPLTVKIGRKP